MLANVQIQSKKKGELNKFLSRFFENNLNINYQYHWKKEYDNPIEIAELVGVYADNLDKFQISMWINLDLNVYNKIFIRKISILKIEIRFLF